jgi:hypothetical protein
MTQLTHFENSRIEWLRKPPNWGGFNSFSSALYGLDVCDGDLAGTTVWLGVEGDFLAFD